MITSKEVIDMLRHNDVVFKFTKLDGSEREIHASRWADIPGYDQDLSHREVSVNDLVSVFERGIGWRSFYVDRLISFTLVPSVE